MGSDGRLRLDEWEEAMLGSSADAARQRIPDGALASLMWANNETGVIQPIREACEIAHQAGVPIHTDAIQAIGKTPVDVQDVRVDYLSISGHKLHAPKGVGAMFIRNGWEFHPMLRGGGQERGLRSGTENVASIVGFGKAAELMKARLDAGDQADLAELRNHFEHRLLSELSGVTVNGSLKYRTANTKPPFV